MRSRIPVTSLDRLRAVPLFADCDTRALIEVDRLVVEADVSAGTTLTGEGRSGRETFIIVSGIAEVTVRGERLAELGPGAVVGDMAVLQRQPRSATVTALSTMHLLVVAPADLAPLLAVEGVARKVMISLSQRLRIADDRLTTSNQTAPLRRESVGA